MENDLTVEGSFSRTGGERSLERLSHISFTEIFEKHLPFYLSIGMSYEQYWFDDCCIAKFYKKAYDLQRDRINEQLWLQGLYIYDALCDVAPALRAMGAKPPEKYVSEPYPLTEKEMKIRKKKREKEKQEAIRAKVSAAVSSANRLIKERKEDNDV